MVSSIEQTGYSLYPGSGTYGSILFTRRLVTVGFGQNASTRFNKWCNSVNTYPTYYTRVIEEGSNREFINNNDTGAPTLPTTVLSEINGSSVPQNLASSSLKEPVKLYFKLKDEYSLPSWLKFQEGSGRIYGKPPDSVSSFTPIIFNEDNKRIEMYLVEFGEPFNQPFDQEKAILFGYVYGIVTYNSIVDDPCPT
jgi:hypothetical protein